MGMDIKKEIRENLVTLIVLSKEQYIGRMSEVARLMNESFSKTLFISLTQPYSSALETLRKNNVPVEKFTFIDVLTSTVRDPDPDPNCSFVSSPSALTEISVAFSKAINDKKCDSAFFDSISVLTIYEDQNAVIKFVHNILTKSRVIGTKTVFVCLKEDKDIPLIKDLYMFVDKVIDLTSPEERIADLLKR